MTWKQYAEELERNLKLLHTKLHEGSYRARPSRRVFIPKPDGSQRPLRIASLEDKIVQRAVVEVLNAIYEMDFLGFSYGFRPGRGQHMALDALATGIRRKKVNWVLRCRHSWILRCHRPRMAAADARGPGSRSTTPSTHPQVAEGGSRRGRDQDTDREGKPAGRYDLAVVGERLPSLRLRSVGGPMAASTCARRCNRRALCRRLCVGFSVRGRCASALGRACSPYGKVWLGTPSRQDSLDALASIQCKERGEGKPGTFDFLGFTHICGRAREGRFKLVRRTSRKRMALRLKAIRGALLRWRHLPVPVQGAWIRRVVRGYFAYHAIPTNGHRLQVFRDEVTKAWLHALRRRSQRHRMTWSRMHSLAERWIPRPRILHPASLA